MKKLYTLIVILCGSTAFAQTYLPLKDFQDSSVTSGGWTTQMVIGTFDWTSDDAGSTGNYYGKASGYSGGAQDSEIWLISPSFDLTSATMPVLNFRNTTNYTGPALEVHVSTDYDGTSDPSLQGTWTDISSSATLSTGSWAWVGSGDVDLSAYNGNGSVYVAFRYTSSTAAGAATWEVDDIEVTEPTQPTSVSIFDIQNSAGDSPYMDSLVATGGIVTAVGTYGYAIQAGTGAFTGLWVQDSTGALTVSRGDSVLVSGTVEEFFSFTRLNNVTSLSVESSGNAEPSATVMTSTSAANAEDWEGVKIRIENTVCTLDNDGFGQWILNDGSGDMLIDNEFYAYPSPTIGNYYWVTGIGWYSFSEFKMQPRDAADVMDVTGVEESTLEFNFYPNPASGIVQLNLPSEFVSVSITDASGKAVYQGYHKNTVRLNVENYEAGVYFIQIRSKNGMAVKQLVTN